MSAAAALAAAQGFALTVAPVARAQSGPSDWTDTTPGGSDYNNAANWDAGVPFNTSAYVNNGGTFLVQARDPAWSVADIQIGQISPNFPNDAGTIPTNTGFVVQTGTAVNASGSLQIANYTTYSGGGYQMGGGSLTIAGQLNAGMAGTGFCNQSAGTVTVGSYVSAGDPSGAFGTIDLAGGTLAGKGR